MSPTICPNCAAQLRNSTSLPRHLGQVASCRHNAHRRARSALSSVSSLGRRKPQLPVRPSNTHLPTSASTESPPLLNKASTCPGQPCLASTIDNSSTHSDDPSKNPANPENAAVVGDTTPAPEQRKSGHPYYRYPTPFEVQKAYRDALRLPPHAPFASEEEWELAEFVVESGLTQGETDRLLKTRMVSHTTMIHDNCSLSGTVHSLSTNCSRTVPLLQGQAVVQ